LQVHNVRQSIKLFIAFLAIVTISSCGPATSSKLLNDYGIDPNSQSYRLCNNSQDTVYIAISDDTDQDVYTRGWESIDKGTCKNLSKFYYVAAGSAKQIYSWAQLFITFRDKPFVPDEGIVLDGKYLCVPNKPVDERNWEFGWDYWALSKDNYQGSCPSGSQRKPSYGIDWANNGNGQYAATIVGKFEGGENQADLNEYGFQIDSLVPNDIQKMISNDVYQFYKSRGYSDAKNPALKIRSELNRLPTDKLNLTQLRLVEALRAWCIALVNILKETSAMASADRNRELEPLDRSGEQMPSLIQGIVTGVGCAVLQTAAGDASDLFEVAAGYTLCGEKLDFEDRLLSGLGLVVGSGAMWRAMANGYEATKDVYHVAGKLKLLSGDVKRLGLSSAKDAESLLEIAGACPLISAGNERSFLQDIQIYINPLYIPDAFAASRCKVDEAIRQTAKKIFGLGFRNGDEAIAFGRSIKGIPGVSAGSIMEIAGNAKRAKILGPEQLKTAVEGGSRSFEHFVVFVRTGVTPNTSLTKLLAPDEAFAAAEIIRRGSTKTDGFRVFGEENLAKFFSIDRNKFPLPEGFVQRNDGLVEIFEVKNQMKKVELESALRKFRVFPSLAKKERLVVGRMDLFVPKGFERFDDTEYSVVNGLLYHRGSPEQIEGLSVYVTERALPAVQ
jgi:hypothetical protein